MILRTSFVLACLIVGAHSLGGMLTTLEFKKFENLCFQNEPTDPFRINGQENPLANSVENFVALAEKFEAANPNLPLKDELFYFLRNFNYENIKLTTDGASQWKPDVANFDEIDKMWEPDLVGMRNRLANLEDPFTDAEKCSLYFMISHSIVDKPEEIPMFRSMSNDSYGGRSSVYRTDLNMEDYFPQEIGVVAVRGSEESVSLSRVLVGMYVGLDRNRKRDIRSFTRIDRAELSDDQLPPEREVDPLYTLTLAEVLMLSSWSMSSRRGLSRDGVWVSYPSDTSKFCPMVYKPQDVSPAYSFATVRGAADGLILGTVVNSIERKKQTAKLSQVLRMYYSWEGIVVDQQATPEVPRLPAKNRISVCTRREAVDLFSGGLEAQMKLYGSLVSEKFEYQKTFDTARDAYTSRKDLIYRIDNKDLQEYCNQLLTPDDVDHLTKETFLDLIVVMDTSSSEVNFKTQQLITGYLASYMDLRNSGSRMSIFMDDRISTDSSSVKIELKAIVLDEYSSSCAACKVGQIAFQRSSVERDQVISAIDQLLFERENNETKQSGANGKVVVFFNFESADRGNKVQGRLDQALRDLFTRHQDTKVYAVGLETEILKKFARNDPAAIILSSEGSEEEVAKKLFKMVSSDSGLLQYSECEDGRGEASAAYENFVSPYAIQHWEMPPRYFYKSIYLKVSFESQNGVVKVCHNRATAKPENEAKFCNMTVNNNRVEFRLSNPCKSLTKETCSPFYFAVIGMGPNGDGKDTKQGDYCTDIKGTNLEDKWCNRLDSIKFKVSHEGVRCSGCLGIVASSLLTLLTALVSYSLQKLF